MTGDNMHTISLRGAGLLLLALCGMPAFADLSTYHVEPLALPALGGDDYAQIGGLQGFDNGHVTAIRNNLWTGTATSELYAVTDMSTPVVTLQDFEPALATFRRYPFVVGEYFYARRWQAGTNTSLGLQRCRYTVACDPLDDAHWQAVAGPGLLALPAQHASNLNMTGIAAYTVHEALADSHRLILADGTSFEFAQSATTTADLNFFAMAPVAGYVDGVLTVIVPTPTGPVAHVFTSLQAGGAVAIPLGNADQWAVDINAGGRLVIATNGATISDPVALAYCDLAVDTTGASPTIDCPLQSLGNHPMFRTGMQQFNRLNDNNQLVFHSGFPDDRMMVLDTEDPSAGTAELLSRVTSGTPPPAGPFRAGTASDGRIVGLPSADNDSLSYDYFLFTPPGGGGGGGGGPVTVDVDVKPGSCTNGLNVDSRGVLPVAIVGNDQFDVTQIDPASVTLATLPALRWSHTDVATPGDCAASSADGYTDLLLMFDSRVLGDLADGLPDGVIVSAPFSGSLLDGRTFSGEGSVKIINKR
jgi:hypothetical protein